MKILVISDTHGILKNAISVIDKVGKIDMCFHLGDVEDDGLRLKEYLKCPLKMVSGNNDFFSLCPKELFFIVDKYKIFMTHGHNYLVSMGTERIQEEAISRGADIVIHGHTHKPNIQIYDDLTLLCPGSISYPRQFDRNPTYIIIEIDKNHEIHYTLNSL